MSDAYANLPAYLAQVFSENYQVREQYEAKEYQREKKRAAAPEIIHKTYDPNERRAAQQPTRPMSAEADAAWNAWWSARFNAAVREILTPAIAEYGSTYVRKRLEEFSGLMGGEVGAVEKQLREEIRAAEERLRAEIISEVGSLRADLTIERAIERENIIDLPDWKKKANA